MNLVRYSMWKSAVVAVLVVWGAAQVRAADSDDLYRAGTDSAARYLTEYVGTLRLTLLLQECGLNDTALVVGSSLPNSVKWFVEGEDAYAVAPALRQNAAQITRSYLLGFEVGVRSEFRRLPDDAKLATCNAAAEAAKS